MNKPTREALEAAGFQVGDFGDFLGLTPEERQVVETRISSGRWMKRFNKEVARLTGGTIEELIDRYVDRSNFSPDVAANDLVDAIINLIDTH